MKTARKARKPRNWAQQLVKTETGVYRDFAEFLRPTETQLQIAVVEHLRLTGVPGLLFFSIPNEGKRTPANGARMKAMGLLPGVADLFVKHSQDEWPLFLELKKRGETPRHEQWEFGRLARTNKCYWSWADNIDDALEILRDYGAIRSK